MIGLVVSFDVLIAVESDHLATRTTSLQSHKLLQTDRARYMTLRKKSLLPTWRAFSRRGAVYESLDASSGSSALELPDFSKSVFVAWDNFENSVNS